MSTKPEINREEAQKWVDSRVWANGWDAIADKSIDAVEFATQYELNKPLWDKLFKYLAETDPKTLQPGKIVLEEGRLWINVLEYTPKCAAETKTESHKDFIDLQYTYEGNEVMGLAHKVTPVTDYDPVKDRTFYAIEGNVDYTPATPDRFFLYFPADMHQPSVKGEGDAVTSRKLVGKIEYAK